MIWRSKLVVGQAQAVLQMMRMKPGLISFGLISSGFGIATYQEGQNIADEYMRYALAGTSAFLIVDVLVHPIDTLNMRSKVLDSKGRTIHNAFRLLRITDAMQLFRGLNAVMYGTVLSGLLYFYAYAKLKKQMYDIVDQRDYKTEEQKQGGKISDGSGDLLKHLAISFSAATISEFLALGLYYPFDLVKTRMQTSTAKDRYTNLIDAAIKIYQERLNVHEKQQYSWVLARLKRFYSGMSLYALTYVTFIAFEFSLYEVFLRGTIQYTKGEISLLQKLSSLYAMRPQLDQFSDTAEQAVDAVFNRYKDPRAEEGPEGKRQYFSSDIVVSAILAGSIASFVTNGLEILQVNKQRDAKFKVMQFMRENFYKVMFAGAPYRAAYYGLQAALVFYLLEEFKVHFKCDHLED